MIKKGVRGTEATVKRRVRKMSNQKQQVSWKKIETYGFGGKQRNIPSKRSGHTFTLLGTNGFLFGGCDNSTPPGPTNELFQLKLSAESQPCEWMKVNFKDGPDARWRHTASSIGTKLYIFGGFHSSTTRFNDLWVFNPITLNWEQPVASRTVFTPRGNHISTPSAWPSCPAPRGGHSSCSIGSRLFIYGGYGGEGYGRRDFDDLCILNIQDMTWDTPVTKGTPPGKRSGHQASAVGSRMYIFGGWDSHIKYNDLFILNTTTWIWSTVEGPHMGSFRPRWSHSSCSVLAIPDYKIFVFGGICGSGENYKAKGEFMNDLSLLDTGTDTWLTPSITGALPEPRADCALSYDSKYSRLILCGGWAQKWFNDVYGLNVSSLVGPPYSISSIFPAKGPLTGGQEITITGMDFLKRPVIARFASTYGAIDVVAEYVNNYTVTVITPDFTDFEAGESDLRIAFEGDLFTTTVQKYEFVSITEALSCFVFGPGVLNGGAAGEPAMFLIQARDKDKACRTTGEDEFRVMVRTSDTTEEVFVTAIVQDQEDGTYIVAFTPPQAATFRIDVEFMGTFGGTAGPIHGSPILVSFNDIVSRDFNAPNGKLVTNKVDEDLQELEKLIGESEEALEHKLVDSEWTEEESENAIIFVKEHLRHIERTKDDIQLMLDHILVTLNYLKRLDSVVKVPERRLKMLEKRWKDLCSKIPVLMVKISPLIKRHQSKTRMALKDYLKTLKLYETEEINKAEFWAYDIGWKQGKRLVGRAIMDFKDKQLAIFQKYERLADIFESMDLLEPCREQLDGSLLILVNVETLWTYAEDMARQIDFASSLKWKQVDATVLRTESERLMKQVESLTLVECDLYRKFHHACSIFATTCPLLEALKDPAVKKRHWEQVMRLFGKSYNEDFELKEVLDLKLHLKIKQIEAICSLAHTEKRQENTLKKFDERWTRISFQKDLKVDLSILEADIVLVQVALGGDCHFFRRQFEQWKIKLGHVRTGGDLLQHVNRLWLFLSDIFINCQDVREFLPSETKEFQSIDAKIVELIEKVSNQVILTVCTDPSFIPMLEELTQRLEKCEKSLQAYLDKRRLDFPRFFFLSTSEILAVLGDPKNLNHIPNVFPSVHHVDESKGAITHINTLSDTMELTQNVSLAEGYLSSLESAITKTLKAHSQKGRKLHDSLQRAEWIQDEKNGISNQIYLLIARIELASKVERAFEAVKRGNANAIKDLYKVQQTQLRDLVLAAQKEQKPSIRARICDLVTYDMYSMEVVDRLRDQRVISKRDFNWTAILRHYSVNSKVQVKMGLSSFEYNFSYTGQPSSLIMTPLTHRAQLAITQALSSYTGSMLVGPSGSGKVSTTRDVANVLGKDFYAINCGAAMNWSQLAYLFKGVAIARAMVHFRDVLSLSPLALEITVHFYNTLCSAWRQDAPHVDIAGQKIPLEFGGSVFFSHTGSPANEVAALTSTFRRVSLEIPDRRYISWIILVSYGFREARELSEKLRVFQSVFFTLLPQHPQYQWGIRTSKTIALQAFNIQREADCSETESVLSSIIKYFETLLLSEHEHVFQFALERAFPDITPCERQKASLADRIRDCCEENQLWPAKHFLSKVEQLHQLIATRSSVLLVGYSGSGKSEIYTVLANAVPYDVELVIIAPKAMNMSRLYGSFTPEWKDGLIPRVLKRKSDLREWIIFDGEINDLITSQTLTLPSNERVDVEKLMIFEVSDISEASPATLAMTGIVFLENPNQWECLVGAYAIGREKDSEVFRKTLSNLCFKYISACLSFHEHNLPYRRIKLTCVAHVQLLLDILDAFLDDSIRSDDLEPYVVYAAVWAFGAALSTNSLDGKNYRKLFSDWWRKEFSTIPFPREDTVFDYFLHTVTLDFEKWHMYPHYQQVQQHLMMIPTPETISTTYFTHLLLHMHQNILICGPLGVGKTLLASSIISLETEIHWKEIKCSSITSSAELQDLILENATYFIDDLSAEAPAELIRQDVDHGFWYDLGTLKEKRMGDPGCNYLMCTRPDALPNRLLRHFCVFMLSDPPNSSLTIIQNALLDDHLQDFTHEIRSIALALVEASIKVHRALESSFPAFGFCTRHLSRVFKGLLQSKPREFEASDKFEAFWTHEMLRTYGDSMSDPTNFSKVMKLHYSNSARYLKEPLVFFKNQPVGSIMSLKDNIKSDLILTSDVLYHMTRIARILQLPYGHGLLVGPISIGRRSAVALAARLLKYESITLDQLPDVAGVQNKSVVVVSTEITPQILEFMLTGCIRNLVPEDEQNQFMHKAGVKSWADLWARIESNCHVMLVSTSLDGIPASILTRVTINLMRAWPPQAYEEIATQFMEEIDVPGVLYEGTLEFFSYVAKSLDKHMTKKGFIEMLRCFSKHFKMRSLSVKQEITAIETALFSLQDIVDQIPSITSEVQRCLAQAVEKKSASDRLEQLVKKEKVHLQEETEKVELYSKKVDKLEEKATKLKDIVSAEMESAQPSLQAALGSLKSFTKQDIGKCRMLVKPPAGITDVFAAVMVLFASINTSIPVTKDGIVKESHRTWTGIINFLLDNVMEFLDGLRSFGTLIEQQAVPAINFKQVRPYLALDHFTTEYMQKKNHAAGGICTWVLNIVDYYDSLVPIEPKRQEWLDAKDVFEERNQDLHEMKVNIELLRTQFGQLQQEYQTVCEIYQRATKTAEIGTRRLEASKRIISALQTENDEWTEKKTLLEEQKKFCCAETLLLSAIVTFAGSFTGLQRETLIHTTWIEKFFHKQTYLRLSETRNYRDILAHQDTLSQWLVAELPFRDGLIENAAIATYSTRWPLIIDPHDQAFEWLVAITEKQAARVHRISESDTSALEIAIEHGHTVIFEDFTLPLPVHLNPILFQIRGKVCLMEKELEIHPTFRLYLYTRDDITSIPAEYYAELTIANFALSGSSLEEYFLQSISKMEMHEQPLPLISYHGMQLEKTKYEDKIIAAFENEEASIIDDLSEIRNLEVCKVKREEIIVEVSEKQVILDEYYIQKETYRDLATHAAKVAEILNGMSSLNPFYSVSLNLLTALVYYAIDLNDSMYDATGATKKPKGLTPFQWESNILKSLPVFEKKTSSSVESHAQRTERLKVAITEICVLFCSQGMHYHDKLLMLTQLSLTLSARSSQYDLLLKNGMPLRDMTPPPHMEEWLQKATWGRLHKIQELYEIPALCQHISDHSEQWYDWYCDLCPEEHDFPMPIEDSVICLAIIRALRPDRISESLRKFIGESLGEHFFEDRSSLRDICCPSTPILMIDPPELPKSAKKVTIPLDSYEIIDEKLQEAMENGTQLLIQNVHFASHKWVKALFSEKQEEIHPKFRCFLVSQNMNSFPMQLVSNSFKMVVNPPGTLAGQLQENWSSFTAQSMSQCSRPIQYQACVFGLSFLHAACIGRNRWNGWLMPHSFDLHQLHNTAELIQACLEDADDTPWKVIQQMVHLSVYGTDKLNMDDTIMQTMIQVVFEEDLLGGKELSPGFECPNATVYSYTKYLEHIIQKCPREASTAYGLRPTIKEDPILPLQAPKSTVSLRNLLARLPSPFQPMQEQTDMILIQECYRMNLLLRITSTSLTEALNGRDNGISPSLHLNQVPDLWKRYSWVSSSSLGSWISNLRSRYNFLMAWRSAAPVSMWLGGLFSPQAYLYRITEELGLVHSHITHIESPDSISERPEHGVYVHGFYLSGAKWRIVLQDKIDEIECGGSLYPIDIHSDLQQLPVMYFSTTPGAEDNTYDCPVYSTRDRSGFIFKSKLPSSETPPQEWVLGNVAIVLDS